jgi:hypothetical protein
MVADGDGGDESTRWTAAEREAVVESERALVASHIPAGLAQVLGVAPDVLELIPLDGRRAGRAWARYAVLLVGVEAGTYASAEEVEAALADPSRPPWPWARLRVRDGGYRLYKLVAQRVFAKDSRAWAEVTWLEGRRRECVDLRDVAAPADVDLLWRGLRLLERARRLVGRRSIAESETREELVAEVLGAMRPVYARDPTLPQRLVARAMHRSKRQLQEHLRTFGLAYEALRREFYARRLLGEAGES